MAETVGPFTIQRKQGKMTIAEEQTIGRETSSGKAVIFEIQYPKKMIISVASVAWQNGEREVRTIDFERGTKAISRLANGLRLGIYPVSRVTSSVKTACRKYTEQTGEDCDKENLRWLELRQARIKPNNLRRWSNLYSATRDELRAGAGFDAIQVLQEAGALLIGTKEQVLKVDDRTRLRLCALFHESNRIFPIVAYTVTRVAPLLNGYTCDD